MARLAKVFCAVGIFFGLIVAASQAAPIIPQQYHAWVEATYLWWAHEPPVSDSDSTDDWRVGVSAVATGTGGTMVSNAYFWADASPQFQQILPDPTYSFFQMNSMADLFFALEDSYGYGSVSQTADVTLWSEDFVVAWHWYPIGERGLVGPGGCVEGAAQLTVVNLTQSTTLLDLQAGLYYEPHQPIAFFEGTLSGNVGDVIRISFTNGDDYHQHVPPYGNREGDDGEGWEVVFGAPVPEPVTLVSVLVGAAVAAAWARKARRPSE